MGEERDGVYVVVLPQKATRADRRTRIASMAFFLFFLGSPGYSDLVVKKRGGPEPVSSFSNILLIVCLMCSQVWEPLSIPITCPPPRSKQEKVVKLDQMSASWNWEI